MSAPRSLAGIASIAALFLASGCSPGEVSTPERDTGASGVRTPDAGPSTSKGDDPSDDAGGMATEETSSGDPWADTDEDGFLDRFDNCPRTKNRDQKDTDGDGVGDVCDNYSECSNKSQKKKVCEEETYDYGRDSDGDGTADVKDVCPNIANPGQTDSDGDGIGDDCDNCPNTKNDLQTDADGDGTGDACEKKPAGQICKRKTAQFKKLQPNIFISLDKSGSMDNNNKMQEAKAALDQLANNLASQARFGLNAYSASCNPPTLLKMGSHSASTIRNSYASVSPGGGTGTGAALGKIRKNNLYWDPSNQHRKQRPKAVILVSDGCSNACGGKSKAAQEATRLHNAGVDVYAIGFTSGACTGELDRIASNGGTGSMYQANNASQLSNTLQSISKKTISCTYKVQAPSAQRIWVKVGGSFIDPSEYDYDASKGTLTLSSSACSQLQSLSSGGSTPLEIVFGCPPQCDESEEKCNYQDDDCDGEVDEGCKGCEPELCDGDDNDCDGDIDEGCCMKKETGESCSMDSECCSGYCREDGTCGKPCRPIGESCIDDSQCCSGICAGATSDGLGSCVSG